MPYSKALQLLALPQNEREKFAEEVGADDMTVKELKAVIEERNAAQKRAEEAEKRAEESEKKRVELEQAVQEANVSADETARLEEKVAELKRKLQEAENGNKLSTEEMESIKADALKEAEENTAENIRKKLEKAKADVKKAKEKQSDAEAKVASLSKALEDTKKQLIIANPEISAFKTLFDEVQTMAQKLKNILEKIRETAPDVAEKLSSAVKAFGEQLQQ